MCLPLCRPLKAMGSKKRAVKAKCANMQKAREVVAQRRAAEAAGPREVEAQAEAIAAEAEAQADAGADEADAQLHQLQADQQHSEQQLAHNQRMQHLQQQLQDLQRSELQRKEQQLADLEAQQRAALLQWEQQLIERQHQLEQQQADLSRREQDLTERQHQLQQQQADLDSREQQQARIQTLPQQLHSLQQELKAQQVAEVQRVVQQQLLQHLLQQQQADLLLMQQQVEKQHLAYLQAISNNHPLPDPSPCSRAKLPSPLQGLDEYQAAAAAIAAAAVGAVLRAAVEAEGQGQQDGWARATRGNRDKAMGRGRGNPTPAISSPPCPEHALSPRPVWDLRSHRQQQQQQPQPLSTSPQAWQRRLQPLLDEFQQYPVEDGAELLDRLQQHRRMRSVVSLATGVVPPTPDQVLGGIMVDSLRPVLASIKPAPGGQRSTNQQPFNTALIMTMGRGIEQHGIKRTARQLGITPHAVKRARRSHLSNLAAGAAADWAAAPLRRGRRRLSQDQLEHLGKHMDSLVLPVDPQPRDDSDSDSGSDSDGGHAEVHVVLAEHIANADAQDLAGVLSAGVLGGGQQGAAVRLDLDYATVQSWFVCPCKVGAKPSLACLQRQCDACKDRKVGVKAGCEGVQLQYRQFNKLDNGQGVELATVQTTLGELVAGLNALMQKQLWHHYLAKHQRATFRAHCAAVQNTPVMCHVVLSCDWSEKLTIHQDIACQGAYWKQRTMSVFVACAHYQDMAGNYREESVFVSADKCDQSAEASTTALVQVIECLLQGRRHLDAILGVASSPDGVGDGRDDGEGWVGKMDMRQLCLWSDGCASQFKGAKAIKLHWHLANRFGVPVQWSYGATSHFKSTHDSEGGVIKREWREQMLVHPELVGTVCGAAVLTDWANRHFAVPCHAQDTSASHRLRGHIMFRRYLVLDKDRQATVCSMPEADVERMHNDVEGCRAMHRMVFTPDREQPQWAMAGCACNTCMSVPCLPCMKPDTTTPLKPMPMFQDTVQEVRDDEECYALLMLFHPNLMYDEECFGKLTNTHCARYRMHMGLKREKGRRKLRRLLQSEQLEFE
ncbi:hypothetical protein QJQ45_003309 [Haematococcus lacustris]|nr:hypothetical protein QJQ45_003309 [Haematococcus lacustris]